MLKKLAKTLQNILTAPGGNCKTNMLEETEKAKTNEQAENWEVDQPETRETSGQEADASEEPLEMQTEPQITDESQHPAKGKQGTQSPPSRDQPQLAQLAIQTQTSLPCAQTKFATQTQSQEYESGMKKQLSGKIISTQEELVSIVTEQNERIRMLESRMKLLEEEVMTNKEHKGEDSNEEQDEKGAAPVDDRRAKVVNHPKKQPVKLQAPKIDGDGNIEPVDNSTSRLEPHALDFVPVKVPRRRWETRTVLSDTMQDVQQGLNKHMEDNYRGDNCPKTRGQKEMTQDQRHENIKKMLDKGSLKKKKNILMD